MQEIKNYIYAANNIVISLMYLKSFPKSNISLNNLKEYSPGHLGCSTSLNFILANLYYFFNKNNITNKIVVGTGHGGASLITNLWLNGTLSNYYPKYSRDLVGLNKLINNFGNTIRSEINPFYPETIYDGGELGYSLATAYGYSINSLNDIVVCIMGDGECETGTLSSSWYLPKILNTKSKVLPIINLNGFKMGGKSILSTMTNSQLINYFSALGYEVFIVDSDDLSIDASIEIMQKTLYSSLSNIQPLIIFKSKKGYLLPDVGKFTFENNISVHKNPLYKFDADTKINIINTFINYFKSSLFDNKDKLLSYFDNFKIKNNDKFNNTTFNNSYNTNDIDEYLSKLMKINNGYVFSPDEILSNGFIKSSEYAIELLNENVLQALYQGFVQSSSFGVYVSYEGFLPIISSMISQYYKYLKQKDIYNITKKPSMNYLLTSTCLENTYSHQNPDIVNTLFERNDKYYNIIYPKDKHCALEFLKINVLQEDLINLIIYSKRHNKVYDLNTLYIEVIVNNDYPDLILCATGDYLLDQIISLYELLKEQYKIKVLYVSKPQILSVNGKESLSNKEFNSYFNASTLYLYSGYSYSIKSLLYDRNKNITILGYDDGLKSNIDTLDNFTNNNLDLDNLLGICNSIVGDKKSYE